MNTEHHWDRPKRLITIEEILHARPQKPTATTRERGWAGMTVDVHRPYYGCAESYPGLDHHLVTYCRSGSMRLIQARAGVVHDSIISTGMAYIMPAGYDSTWEGDTGATARVRMPISLIGMAAEQVGRRSMSQVEIRNIFEIRDRNVECLLSAMLAEMELRPHPTQRLIIDSLSSAFAAHMLRCYNAFEVPEIERAPGLGQTDLKRLTNYIEDNLDRTIGLAELATIVNVSRFHFTRLFKRSTGMTAISFVEQCRIRRAQSLLAETDIPLAQVALMTGFADQSHFTRRFHRVVGCTPAGFAREQGRRRSALRSTN